MASSTSAQVAVLDHDVTSHNLSVPAADVLRLIQAHLVETGLHQTCQMLQNESGVGLAGALHSNWRSWAHAGQWALILKSLQLLDAKRSHLDSDLLASAHEMAILELAEAGDLELAYATYRLVQNELQQSPADEQPKELLVDDSTVVSRARLLEQRLAALASARSKDPKAPVPKDYYGSNTTKQERRDELGVRLQEAIPHQPAGRLNALIQQAIKWQTHTGQVPRIRQWWETDENDDKEPKHKKKKRRKEFDLVLGEVSVDTAVVGESLAVDHLPAEPIPSHPYSTIRFGKKATAESAVFLPDASGLVTGSSDGLIEIWDAALAYQELRMDLPYQQNEELLGHDTAITALTVSNDGLLLASGSTDGIVKVWRIDTGKCLREIAAHPSAAVSCLCFSPDASHILTGSHDGTIREFGLRTSRMLKEFQGHVSYVNTCAYHLLDDQLVVVTGAADGTVRLWNSKTSDVLRVFRPISLGPSLTAPGASILVNHRSDFTAEGGSPSVHSVLPLHSPPNTMIVVPRGLRAFLVNYQGAVLKVFDDNVASGKVFVAATVSSTNRWLYAVKEDGVCCVFNVATGELETTIPNFGAENTSRSKDSTSSPEISAIFHHPTKSIVGAFSNDKGQKRGQIVLWK